ncbi:MAG: RNA polymerase sigma factor [Planctomyces sp.]|nr:RNA polymerase sigma factor [Planctomyces sp.]
MKKTLERLEEQQLVIRAQSGDGLAFRQLVESYDRRLWYFVRRMLDDEQRVADVLQEVWLNVFRSLYRLGSPAAFRVWVYRIAHDRAISELRRTGREIPAEALGDHDLPAADSSDADMAEERAELVHKGLSQLAIEHRRVLTLLYLEQMSIQEISEVLGCNPGTVKSRLHYARKALADWLREQNL